MRRKANSFVEAVFGGKSVWIFVEGIFYEGTLVGPTRTHPLYLRKGKGHPRTGGTAVPSLAARNWYPLIHNSEFIRDFGYFYPDFDCQAGGNALVQAFETHDKNLGNYKAKATALLKTLDIQSPENIEAYSNELISLF